MNITSLIVEAAAAEEMREAERIMKKIKAHFKDVFKELNLEEGQREFESALYERITREHLAANGKIPDEELVCRISNELADAAKKRTVEWKRPLPEVINLGDEEQMKEMMENHELHLHDILEYLGYGSYDPE